MNNNPHHQLQQAEGFARRIDRQICLRERHNGYALVKPGTKHFGFVRFNVRGTGAGRYIAYAYCPFSDPVGRFQNTTKGKPNQAWWCVANPDYQEAIGYVITVLESSYDQK